MGCSLFYKKCQEADTVSKLILLGVPNSIKEDVIKDTLDKVLSELECTLLQTDSEYKLTKDQRQNWINYAVDREFPPGMPWEDAEEKKKKQGYRSPGIWRQKDLILPASHSRQHH